MHEEEAEHREHLLQELRHLWVDCTACNLHEERKNIVFGTGPPDARIMIVAEGPGEQEDIHGLPFVGPAGETLTNILDAVRLERERIYITNMVMCRPPDNRDPTQPEIQACWPRLEEQIHIVSPDIIVTLGAVSSKTVLKERGFSVMVKHGIPRITTFNGQHTTYDIAVMPILHPSWLRKNFGLKIQGPVHRAVLEFRAVRDAADLLEWLRRNATRKQSA